ncbi:MAG TPA: right-handed parallel beta-helix repeat-containing protein [Phycisphaerae bacterium]|nr:right-handed parallel beta-helix repeat-containing protein [Phycisphaerae bacterium]
MTRWMCIACPILMASLAVRAAEKPAAPPWTPTYKIRPDEKDRLTPADVVGPDGIVYPDWRWAGVPGGIPQVPDRARIEDFGGKADDDADDSAAIEKGVREVARRGGGALVFAKGVYHLDRPVLVTDDGVVLRGQGADATRLVFRYHVPEGTVRFFRPGDGETIGPDTVVEVHAAPDNLERITVAAGGKTVGEYVCGQHSGGTYLVRVTGESVVRRTGVGRHRLTAVACWTGGRTAEAAVTVEVDPTRRLPPGSRRYPTDGKASAAILFAGDYRSGATWRLAADGKRGDTEIALTQEPDLAPGDALALLAPATPRWNQLVRNACKWGYYRRYEFRVEAVSGKRVRLNQPLRYDFPLADTPTATRVYPIRRCGVENLSLEQTHKLWTTGVLFAGAWECWARGVTVIKAGRNPVYGTMAKWCEIRDCVFDDAWYHGGGGTAYVGWDRCYDCLMENVTTHRMRHAPCVQWSASGNVIRASTFHGSDAQWHAGWTNENLFEQCVVDARGGTGSYGHGGWASPPEDAAHGPEGPRNVIYNCDITSRRTGLWMGGMNENWLVLHNRFVVGDGPGIVAKTVSFDHIIRGNVIALSGAKQPAVHLATADCTGVEIVGNRIYGGSGQLVAGPGRPLLANDNAFAPPTDAPPRPQPPVPSIFRWQRERASTQRQSR